MTEHPDDHVASHGDSHLDLEAMADALAAAEDGAALPEHLRSCAACATRLEALRAALGAVASDLAELPAVPPVPASLQRSVVPTPSPGATTVLPARPVASLDEARARRTRLVLAAGGLAAAAVVVVGGGLLLSHNATDTHGAATNAAGVESPRVQDSGTDYRSPAALQAALPGLLSPPTPAPGKTVPSPLHGLVAATPDPLARLRTPAGLQGCLASLTDPADRSTPLALDYATYKGAPALVVVLPSAKPSKLDIWVVGAGCTQLESDLLLYVKADRPTK
ncbi:MAG: putative zinc-finger [Frankiales bacterium]|nr:putative zinc-finger [Frankiales bacterium]